MTTVQGLDDDLDLKRICKAMKKVFNCNGSIVTEKAKKTEGDHKDKAEIDRKSVV